MQAISQELNIINVDSITYIQFANHQYDSLKKTGKEALAQNIDFYYLRMRLGIVYYEDKNYEKALLHFTKANNMNLADTINQEYLYYSYLFSGRTEEANLFAQKLSIYLQNKIEYKQKTIDMLAIGGGYLTTNNIDANKNSDIKNQENIYGEALYNGDKYYANILMQQTFLNRLKIYYGISLFNTIYTGVVQSTDTMQIKEHNNNHYQYNLAFSYQFKKGWNISGGFAYFKQQIFNFSGRYDSINDEYGFVATNKPLESYSGTISLSKRMRYVQSILSGSTSNFANRTQYQGELSLVYYPFGNINFYGISSTCLLNDNQKNNWIFTQKIGGKLFNWLWYEIKGSYGNHNNYTTQSGFLAYNTSNPVKLTVGADLKIYWKNLEITPGYRFIQSENTYLYYTSYTTYKTKKYIYNNHLINTTLTWNF